MRFVDVFGGTT